MSTTAEPDAPEPFKLLVVGDAGAMTPEELASLLDVLVASKQSESRPITLVTGGACPALAWAKARQHELLPAVGEHPVRAICDAITLADAVVILGDAEPFRLLAWLARQAEIPVRVIKHPPKAWRPRVRVTNLPD